MTLKEYYKDLGKKSTPQKEFRELIARECGVSVMTVFRWLSDDPKVKIVPEKLKREKLAELTGLTIEELFPNFNEDGTEAI